MNRALLVVDVQNDFTPGGALAVQGGDQVVPVLNKYAAHFAAKGWPVFYSRDLHPEETKHFVQQGGVWPPHCVQGTEGAEYHPELELPQSAVEITKGQDPNEDAYSAFQARNHEGKLFGDLLRELKVEKLYVGGLATDYCVKSSVLDALKAGFEVDLLIDAARGVDVNPGDTERAIAEMVNAGAGITTLELVLAEDE